MPGWILLTCCLSTTCVYLVPDRVFTMSPSGCIPCPGLCPTLPTCHLETGCEARRFERRFNLGRKISCGTVVAVPWIDRESHRGKITPDARASALSERYPANIISSMLHSDSSRNFRAKWYRILPSICFPPVCPPISMGGLVGAISCPHAPTNGVLVLPCIIALQAS